MLKQLLKDTKEATSSLAPVIILVLIAQLFTGFMSGEQVIRWLFGGLLSIIGLFLFLRGVEFCLLPLGDFLGSRLPLTPFASLMILFAILIGIAANIADPSLSVLAQHIQNASSGSGPSTSIIILVVVLGIGIFLALSLLRIALGWNLKVFLGIIYSAMLTISLFVPKVFLGLSLDSGGVATGPLTVPFLLALGMGFVGVLRGKENMSDGFGVLGILVTGPIFGVMLLGIISS